MKVSGPRNVAKPFPFIFCYTFFMNWWVLRRRLHSSWHIAILSIAILFGISLSGSAVPTRFSSVSWLLSGLIILVVVFWRRYVYLIPVLIIGGAMIGLWRGSIHEKDLSSARNLYGTEIVITGKVKEDVDTNQRGELTVRLADIKRENELVPGTFWVTLTNTGDVKRGDIVTVSGDAGKGFGSFVASMYNAKLIHIQRPEPGDQARVWRDWFAEAVHEAIPEPEASLGLGYLVGQKRALPEGLVLALQMTGLTHIVVASGYNLTILVRFARRLFEKVSKYLSALSASVMIFFFIAITGLSPSMSRAGLVAGLSLAAWYYGRKFHPLVLLPLAAVITALLNPSYLWGDLGWQLSFAAFAGVMILAPLLNAYFFGDKKENALRRIFIETLSAFIMTAPILVGAFGQVSNVAIIANVLILPLVPLAMLLTFIAGVGFIVLPSFASLIAQPASWMLGYMTNVIEYLSKLPWAVRDMELSQIGVGVCYLIITSGCFYLWRITKYNLRDSNIVE